MKHNDGVKFQIWVLRHNDAQAIVFTEEMRK